VLPNPTLLGYTSCTVILLFLLFFLKKIEKYKERTRVINVMSTGVTCNQKSFAGEHLESGNLKEFASYEVTG